MDYSLRTEISAWFNIRALISLAQVFVINIWLIRTSLKQMEKKENSIYASLPKPNFNWLESLGNTEFYTYFPFLITFPCFSSRKWKFEELWSLSLKTSQYHPMVLMFMSLPLKPIMFPSDKFRATIPCLWKHRYINRITHISSLIQRLSWSFNVNLAELWWKTFLIIQVIVSISLPKSWIIITEVDLSIIGVITNRFWTRFWKQFLR